MSIYHAFAANIIGKSSVAGVVKIGRYVFLTELAGLVSGEFDLTGRF
jgi:hypothetical protein